MSLKEAHCIPCKPGDPPVSSQDIVEYTKELNPGWKIDEEKKLSRVYMFTDFMESMGFVRRIADVAEEQQHHPDIHIFYNKVVIDLWTHDVGGLSKNDFIMAAKIDSLDEPA